MSTLNLPKLNNKSVSDMSSILYTDNNNILETVDLYKIYKKNYSFEKAKKAIKLLNISNKLEYSNSTNSLSNSTFDNINNNLIPEKNKFLKINIESIEMISNKSKKKLNIKISKDKNLLPSKIDNFKRPPIDKSLKTRVSNNTSLPNNKSNFKNNSKLNTSSSIPSMKKNRAIQIIKDENEYLQLINLTDQNYSQNGFKRNSDSIENNLKNSKKFIKILPVENEKLKILKKRYYNNEKMTRGEIIEAIFGKEIPKIDFKNSNEINKKNHSVFLRKVNEIMTNNPELIIDLIEKGGITEQQVIDYFNIGSLKITWTEELEMIYREIVYNEISAHSNILKTNYFLIRLGFHNVIRKKFEEKNLVSINCLSQQEVTNLTSLYDKIVKYPIEVIKNACVKIESIFQTKDKIIENMVNKARNKFYSQKVKDFRIKESKEKLIDNEVEILEKKQKVELKKFIFNLRKSIKKISPKTSNKNSFTQPIKICNTLNVSQDKANIQVRDKLKKKKNFIKVLIKIIKKDMFNLNDKFDWKENYNKNDTFKKIINYYAINIQAFIRGHLIRNHFKKLRRKLLIIQKYLRIYVFCKKVVMSFFNVKDYKFVESRKNILINSLLKNYKNLGLYLLKEDKEKINLFTNDLLLIKDFKVPNTVKLHKILLFIDDAYQKISHIWRKKFLS